jgi:hypothetical protein
MVFEFITLEERFLSEWLTILEYFAPGNGWKERKLSLFEKAFDCLFIPHIIIFEIPITIIQGVMIPIAGPSTTSAPPHAVEDIFQILKDSSGLAFEYYLEKSPKYHNLELAQIHNPRLKLQEDMKTFRS